MDGIKSFIHIFLITRPLLENILRFSEFILRKKVKLIEIYYFCYFSQIEGAEFHQHADDTY